MRRIRAVISGTMVSIAAVVVAKTYAQEGTVMTDHEPEPRDGAYLADAAFGYHHETPEQRYERRSRNVAVIVAVVSVLAFLALLAMGFAVLFVLHAIASTL